MGQGWAELIEAAKALAWKYHEGQVDKSGKPYIGHLSRVAASVPAGECEVVAWLHDIVEDTTMTLSELADRGFPDNIVNAVEAITHKVDEARADYIERVSLSPIAAIVKLHDIQDNIDPSRIREWERMAGKSKASYVAGRKHDYETVLAALTKGRGKGGNRG